MKSRSKQHHLSIKSVEETNDFTTNMSASSFFMSIDSLVGWDNQMSELSRRENRIGPLFEVREGKIISWGNNSTFVNSSDQLNDYFFTTMVIDNFELSNVSTLLHKLQEFYNQTGDWSNQHLFLSFSFSVDDGTKTILENVYSDHY